jgi:transaldolase
MRIFLDTGNLDAIKKGVATGLITGVTTNPTHIAKTRKKFFEVISEICKIVPGPVSVEAMADDADGLIREARKIAELAPNIAIKIPMTIDGLKAVPVLTREYNIKTNVTMVFSATQATLAMLAGTTFVSIVLSRLDAIATESRRLVEDTVKIKRNYGFQTEVLAASLKTQNHVLESLRAGADIITIPDALFFQMYEHPLTDAGLAQFRIDWEKVPR